MQCKLGLVRLVLCLTFTLGDSALSQTSTSAMSASVPSTKPSTAADLGVSFVKDSTTRVVIEKDGKKYLVDLVTRDIHEDAPAPETVAPATAQVAESAPPANDPAPAKSPVGSTESRGIYRPGDDLVFSVPTGRAIDRHGLYINFTHRFPYEAAFTGTSRGGTLLGLDDFAIPSFGLRYGLTSKVSISAFRSPSIIGRPLELMVAYHFLDEHQHSPINAAVRFSADGQNDLQKNFSENFELIVSRSLGKRAQLYAVPTLSIHARPVLSADSIVNAPIDQPCGAMPPPPQDVAIGVKPCANIFSLGTALAVDIRPTVALVAEAIPTLVNGRDLAIHRPAYGFGIQKKIWRHAFTFGFTTGPSTIVSQREATRASFLGDPSADKPGGLFVGFDLSRQIF
jgi:hypothetical protein